MNMHHPRAVVSHHEPHTASFRSYVIGYALSLITTLLSYTLVRNHVLAKNGLLFLLASLAIAQFLVQAIFFLHLGRETKPRLKLLVFGFMTMVVLIIVIGSIWIMNNLNYYMMTPQDLKHYMHTEEGL